MPSFYFLVRTADNTARLVQECEVPTLQEALAAANGAARALVNKGRRRPAHEFRGSLDIDDDRQRTVARIMFADVALGCG